jgi:beta-galactosidase GanA
MPPVGICLKRSPILTLLEMKTHALPVILSLLGASIASAEPARLVQKGNAAILEVDGAPFLMLAGELGNSSGEAGYLESYRQTLASLNMNTLLVPASWNLIEPEEGRYDWSSVDGMIRLAREDGYKLVFLWFGSWKNSMSCYVPDWVKTDQARFPRCETSTGETLEMLSPFSPANLEADRCAFTALMKHIREVDAAEGTVILVQVENEIGMIGDARDNSPLADAAFAAPVPAALMDYVKAHADTITPLLRRLWVENGKRCSGTWAEVFGTSPDAEEVFMAWHYAWFTNAVAEAGKAEYPLPMYVNAALIRPGHVQGQYPSAGPLPHLIDVWRAAAPAIDFLSPDIYFRDYVRWSRAYHVPGNPVFIPENMLSNLSSTNALYAIGQLDALGYSPFAIESIGGKTREYLAASYDMLGQLRPLIVEAIGTDRIAGCISEGDEQRQPMRVTLGGVTFHVTFDKAAAVTVAEGTMIGGGTSDAPSGCIAIMTGEDEIVFGGTGVTIVFSPADGEGLMGILSCEEGRYENGQWQHIRWLSGDQTHQGRHVRMDSGRFGILKVKLYRYR